MCCLFCVVLCIVCKCVLYYCHRVATQLQLTNISNNDALPEADGRTLVRKISVYLQSAKIQKTIT